MKVSKDITNIVRDTELLLRQRSCFCTQILLVWEIRTGIS